MSEIAGIESFNKVAQIFGATKILFKRQHLPLLKTLRIAFIVPAERMGWLLELRHDSDNLSQICNKQISSILVKFNYDHSGGLLKNFCLHWNSPDFYTPKEELTALNGLATLCCIKPISMDNFARLIKVNGENVIFYFSGMITPVGKCYYVTYKGEPEITFQMQQNESRWQIINAPKVPPWLHKFEEELSSIIEQQGNK